MTALIDTSFLLALADAEDRNHSRALGLAQTINEPLILPIPVLPEICYLLASRLGHQAMRHFLSELTTSDTALEPITKADLQRITEVLNQYADSRLDFVDATIVTIAERKNIIRVLTFDRRDFSIIRPRHSPYFELLP